MIASVLQRRRFGIPRDPEPEPVVHEFSSTQLEITGHPAEIMKKMTTQIDMKDLRPEDGAAHSGPTANDGIEHDPHITCRWGLHFQTPSMKLRNALKAFGPISISFGKTSLFSNPEYDVLKLDVSSPDLQRLYKVIGRLVPTHETFPVYRPHATLAYLKPGRGKKYAGDAALNGQKVNFDSILFTGKRGHREVLPLTGAGMRFRA